VIQYVTKKGNLRIIRLCRSGLKTSPQAQFLCWTEEFNTRNIKYIPVFESLGPPWLWTWLKVLKPLLVFTQYWCVKTKFRSYTSEFKFKQNLNLQSQRQTCHIGGFHIHLFYLFAHLFLPLYVILTNSMPW